MTRPGRGQLPAHLRRPRGSPPPCRWTRPPGRCPPASRRPGSRRRPCSPPRPPSEPGNTKRLRLNAKTDPINAWHGYEPAAEPKQPRKNRPSPLSVGGLVAAAQLGCYRGRLLTKKKGRCRVAVQDGPRAGESIKCLTTQLTPISDSTDTAVEAEPFSPTNNGARAPDEITADPGSEDREEDHEDAAAQPTDAARKYNERELARRGRKDRGKGADGAVCPTVPPVTIDLEEALWPQEQCWAATPNVLLSNDSAPPGRPAWQLSTDWCAWQGLHPWAKIAVDATPLLAPEDHALVQTLHIYTDGTGGSTVPGAESTPAAWAAVITAQLRDGSWRLCGGTAGLTVPQTDPYTLGHDPWIGAAQADVAASELSAIYWSLEWASRAWPGTPVVLTYDSMPAANAAMGRAGIRGQDTLVGVVRHRYRSFSATAGCDMVRVHSHIGHPWNEAVDSLASYRSHGHHCSGPTGDDAPPCEQIDRLVQDWLWLHDATAEVKAAYPGEAMFYRGRAAPTPGYDWRHQAKDTDEPMASPARIDIRLAAYNACSLRDDDKGSLPGGARPDGGPPVDRRLTAG